MTLQLNNAQGNNVQLDYTDQVGGSDVDILFPQTNGTVALAGAAGGLAGNISNASIFRLESSINSDVLVEDWQVPNETGEIGGVGNQVTCASGIFTFPNTGIWLVVFKARFLIGNQGTCQILTRFTTDGGTTWDTRGTAAGGNSSSTVSLRANSMSMQLFNITDTAQRQVTFLCNNLDVGTVLEGNNSFNATTVLFLRLGDTT